jgi:hypothetical protein
MRDKHNGEPRAAEPAPAAAAQLEALKKWAAELQADLERLRERIQGPAGASVAGTAGISRRQRCHQPHAG